MSGILDKDGRAGASSSSDGKGKKPGGGHARTGSRDIGRHDKPAVVDHRLHAIQMTMKANSLPVPSEAFRRELIKETSTLRLLKLEDDADDDNLSSSSSSASSADDDADAAPATPVKSRSAARGRKEGGRWNLKALLFSAKKSEEPKSKSKRSRSKEPGKAKDGQMLPSRARSSTTANKPGSDTDDTSPEKQAAADADDDQRPKRTGLFRRRNDKTGGQRKPGDSAETLDASATALPAVNATTPTGGTAAGGKGADKTATGADPQKRIEAAFSAWAGPSAAKTALSHKKTSNRLSSMLGVSGSLSIRKEKDRATLATAASSFSRDPAGTWSHRGGKPFVHDAAPPSQQLHAIDPDPSLSDDHSSDAADRLPARLPPVALAIHPGSVPPPVAPLPPPLLPPPPRPDRRPPVAGRISPAVSPVPPPADTDAAAADKQPISPAVLVAPLPPPLTSRQSSPDVLAPPLPPLPPPPPALDDAEPDRDPLLVLLSESKLLSPRSIHLAAIGAAVDSGPPQRPPRVLSPLPPALVDSPPPDTQVDKPTDQSVHHQVSDQSIIDQPIIDQPIIDQPIIDQPIIDHTIADQPIIDHTIADQPIIDHTIADQPIIDQPRIDQPVISDRIDQAGTEQPVDANTPADQANSAEQGHGEQSNDEHQALLAALKIVEVAEAGEDPDHHLTLLRQAEAAHEEREALRHLLELGGDDPDASRQAAEEADALAQAAALSILNGYVEPSDGARRSSDAEQPAAGGDDAGDLSGLSCLDSIARLSYHDNSAEADDALSILRGYSDAADSSEAEALSILRGYSDAADSSEAEALSFLKGLTDADEPGEAKDGSDEQQEEALSALQMVLSCAASAGPIAGQSELVDWLLPRPAADETARKFQLDPEVGFSLKGKVLEIVEELGSGATATVFKGMIDGCVVALKQFELENMENKKRRELRKSLKIEVDMMKDHVHPNILQYFGSFYSSKTMELNVVIEYVSARDVTSQIKSGPLNEVAAAHIVFQTLQGLAFLHAKNIMHRDIKPDNLLLDHDGTVKLADFGIAAQLENDAEKRTSSVGTPWYTAPEVINGEEYSYTCDVWSLGCTLFELLTARPPYADANPMIAVYKMTENLHPPLPRNCSALAQQFLLCTWVRGDARPSARDLLFHPWLAKNLVRGREHTVFRS